MAVRPGKDLSSTSDKVSYVRMDATQTRSAL